MCVCVCLYYKVNREMEEALLQNYGLARPKAMSLTPNGFLVILNLTRNSIYFNRRHMSLEFEEFMKFLVFLRRK